MPKEADLSYHVHFEYIVDGKYKEPGQLLLSVFSEAGPSCT